MRIKALLLVLFVVIFVAFVMEPEPESTKAKRSVKQPLSATKTIPVAEKPLPPTPVEDRYETFPPQRVVGASAPKASVSNQSATAQTMDAWSTRSWLPEQPKVVRLQTLPAQVVQQSATAQTMPALPFEFVGAMDAPSGGQLIFLRQGEIQLSVQVGDTIEQQWRVEKLASDRVIFKHLATNTDTFVARGHIVEQ
jgi:hypothetical protein